MVNRLIKKSLAFAVLLLLAAVAHGVKEDSLQSRPSLIFNGKDVIAMRQAVKSNTVFAQRYQAVKQSLDTRMEQGINVPVPKDAGGGFTHEQHKKNSMLIHDAGVIYQISQDTRYAVFATEILNAYAELYPGLGEHPKKKEQSPGRLFWQSLNEAVWLVYSIQGYDAIANSLSEQQRQYIEQNVLLPMADFLSEQSPQTFNKIHNHGTWAAAAVGMTGYALGKDKMVEQALLGLDRSGNAGFLKQLDKLFSPDGYYTEGPYYQRYALLPFIVFARAVEENDPDRKIFAYRDGILEKAVYTTLQLSYNKFFFPINDALTDKGIDTRELVYGVDIIYALNKDPQLLAIANLQKEILLTGDGLKVAAGIANNKTQPFAFSSLLLSDGQEGNQGALVIIRSGSELDDQALVLKNTSQGMGHGHFDKLNWLFYDNGLEIVTDYGAARYLNVESKYGGHYLPENKTWAKQTVAHNTVVVDETSHFNGKLKRAFDKAPEQLIFSEQDNVTFSSAKMNNVNKGVHLVRSVASLTLKGFDHPIVVDILKVSSESPHQYDLPLYYRGQLVNHNFPITANAESLSPLGKRNGYQHLWNKAVATPDAGMAQVTWLLADRFYSYSQVLDGEMDIHFVELGANDPEFNLRRENGLLTRSHGSTNKTFVSVLEPHGKYNPRLEYTLNSYSQIANIESQSEDQYQLITLTAKSGQQWQLAISYDINPENSHKVAVQDRSIQWQGYFQLFEVKQ